MADIGVGNLTQSASALERMTMGPLRGVRVVEMAGLGPAPFCAMVLADLGADVIRIERGEPSAVDLTDALLRSRSCVGLDLKQEDGRRVALDLVERSDVLIEGYRPGVMERLGLGPEPCLERNPKLVYGRVTGWGQDGPLAGAAGHDINFLALAGVLAHLGRAGEPPTPPLNLLADFGGGGMLLAVGVLGALLHAARSGEGQVIDAAMVDGSALLMTYIWSLSKAGVHSNERGTNVLDGGAPYYGVYDCSDGSYISVGAIEPQFYEQLLRVMGLADDPVMADRQDRARWPAQKARLAEVMASRSSEEWCRLMEGTDACFAPVLAMDAAAVHPHNFARGTFVTVDGMVQPSPAPRFQRSTLDSPTSSRRGAAASAAALAAAGLSATDVDDLRRRGVVR